MANRRILSGRAIASEGLLTGIIKCGLCGRNCYFKNRRYKKNDKEYIRGSYLCQTHVTYGKSACRRHVIAAEKIHDIILSEIQKLIDRADKQKRLSPRRKESSAILLTRQVEARKKVLSKLQTESTRLLRAYTGERITLEEFGKEKTRIDAESKILQGEIDHIYSTIEKQHGDKDLEKSFILMLKNFKDKFENLDFKAKKDLIIQLISSISIGNEREIDITYRLN